MSDEDLNKPLPQKKFIKLPKPKHAEYYSTLECAKFQPWKVVLKVEKHKDEPEPINYEVFCRAQNVNDAQYTAYQAFNVWEHHRVGIDPFDWPKVCETGSEAYRLSESQWNEYWKEAQRYPHTHTGMKENPSIFRFARPGWDRTSGILRPGNASIIVPDTSAINAVNKTKNKQ